MARQEQVLVLDPQYELHFKGPFTDVVTSNLKLNNPTDRRVCFKVKTTAPKRYCVRPNSGIIEPKQAVTVAVMLQPFEYDPNEKNKHKFMVQTMFAPEGDVNQDTLWRDANPEGLMDSKLRCVFELPAENAAQNNLDTSASHGEDKVTTSKVAPEPVAVAKSSPKASNVEAELRKALEECKRLKDEAGQLRQENTQLKEEGLRLRVTRIPATESRPSAQQLHTALSGDGKRSQLKSVPLQQDQPLQLSALHYAVMFMICLVGIILGKFVL